LDSQTIELVGRSHLVSELLRAGLEVAMPMRDRGIDLIAYLDIGQDVTAFTAVPIQMKVASERSFSVARKYDKFPNLVHAYVWGLQNDDCLATYALTQDEATRVATEMGYADTDSWKVNGYYATTRPSQKLLSLLKPYLMTPARWRAKVLGLLPREAAYPPEASAS
jgi:hypothetical protein